LQVQNIYYYLKKREKYSRDTSAPTVALHCKPMAKEVKDVKMNS
jgi:hypothetical protein